MSYNKNMANYRLRRFISVIFVIIVSLVFLSLGQNQSDLAQEWQDFMLYDVGFGDFKPNQQALEILEQLAVKGRAPKTNYYRQQFSPAWGQINNCDLRNLILQRDLKNVKLAKDNCKVLSGILKDKYSGEEIKFERGAGSNKIQIDHIVAVSDAWQKGAQQLDAAARYSLANDPLNLLAVDGDANQAKGDSDAASWVPSNKSFSCKYVARQVAVKKRYQLWVTAAEQRAMAKILSSCPDEPLP